MKQRAQTEEPGMSANPKQSTTAQRPIINIDEVELQPRPPERAPKGPAAGRFDARVGMIAPQLGAQKLGYNITAVPPGKRAHPFHNHRINEEMFYVIDGTGEVRIGGAVYPIRAGDIIACPPGGFAVLSETIRFVSRESQQLDYWEGE
jgi:quercetin dioxygenase-like cupin family protein